jgi:hypothetical protein
MIGDFFRRLFGVPKLKTVGELRKFIKPGDVYALANWIDWRIEYAPDNPDGSEEWLPAAVTIKRGKGDCDDKAVVAWEIGKTWEPEGWKARLFVMTRPNPKKKSGMDAHAICGLENSNTGERWAVEGPRAHCYEMKDGSPVAWGWIFADIGKWERHWEVDNKGRVL